MKKAVQAFENADDIYVEIRVIKKNFGDDPIWGKGEVKR